MYGSELHAVEISMEMHINQFDAPKIFQRLEAKIELKKKEKKKKGQNYKMKSKMIKRWIKIV